MLPKNDDATSISVSVFFQAQALFYSKCADKPVCFLFLLLLSSVADPHVASASPEASNCQHYFYEMTQ